MSFAEPPNATGRRVAVPLAPLLDMLFLLLIFFAVTSTFRASEQEFDIDLAAARTGEPIASRPSETIVNVRPDGSLVVFGAQYSIERFEQLMRDLLAHSPDERVILRGDQAVPYGKVIAVMDAARAAGVQSLTVSVRPAGGQGE